MSFQLSISQWGLLCDIFGAAFIFFFGLPSKYVPTDGKFIITEELEGQELISANKRNTVIKLCSNVGGVLLFFGFLFQFIGSSK